MGFIIKLVVIKNYQIVVSKIVLACQFLRLFSIDQITFVNVKDYSPKNVRSNYFSLKDN